MTGTGKSRSLSSGCRMQTLTAANYSQLLTKLKGRAVAGLEARISRAYRLQERSFAI